MKSKNDQSTSVNLPWQHKEKKKKKNALLAIFCIFLSLNVLCHEICALQCCTVIDCTHKIDILTKNQETAIFFDWENWMKEWEQVYSWMNAICELLSQSHSILFNFIYCCYSLISFLLLLKLVCSCLFLLVH